MPDHTIEQLTKQQIKPLPIADQLRLAALITKNLADQMARPDPLKKQMTRIAQQ